MSLELNVEKYCNDCPDFEAKVDKINIETDDSFYKCFSVISCKNREKCHHIAEYIERYFKKNIL